MANKTYFYVLIEFHLFIFLRRFQNETSGHSAQKGTLYYCFSKMLSLAFPLRSFVRFQFFCFHQRVQLFTFLSRSRFYTLQNEGRKCRLPFHHSNSHSFHSWIFQIKYSLFKRSHSLAFSFKYSQPHLPYSHRWRDLTWSITFFRFLFVNEIWNS